MRPNENSKGYSVFLGNLDVAQVEARQFEAENIVSLINKHELGYRCYFDSNSSGPYGYWKRTLAPDAHVSIKVEGYELQGWGEQEVYYIPDSWLHSAYYPELTLRLSIRNSGKKASPQFGVSLRFNDEEIGGGVIPPVSPDSTVKQIVKGKLRLDDEGAHEIGFLATGGVPNVILQQPTTWSKTIYVYEYEHEE